MVARFSYDPAFRYSKRCILCSNCGLRRPPNGRGKRLCSSCSNFRTQHSRLPSPEDLLRLRRKEAAFRLGLKICGRCDRLQPKSGFHGHSTAGHQGECKTCQLKHSLEWQRAHPEKISASFRAWRLANPVKDAERSDRRRALKLSRFVSNVDRLRVYDRDRWVCQLCHKKVNPKKKHPDPMSASLDHQVPLAAGGTHEPRNTQLAHLRCNLQKGARRRREQLRLFDYD